MTPEERIARLEEQVGQLKAQAAETLSTFFYVAGAARTFEAAVLALLASSQQPDAVGRAIAWHLERLDAELVCESRSDEQLEGAQSAKEIVFAAIEAARTLALQAPPAG